MRQRFPGTLLVLMMLLILLAVGGTAHAGGAVQTAGDVVTVLLPVTAGGMILGLKDGEGALQLAESGLLTLGVTYVLKYAVDERRPNGEQYSFPSAHTSVSFASAEYLRKRYGWELGVPAYALASFVAYSRVDSDQHYAHDVIAGAAIGIASSYLFTKPYKGWRIRAEADLGYYGVRLSRSW
jgi:membrane-associated phospholipid phosphatase